MAKKKSKKNKIGHANFETNKQRKMRKEIVRCEKKGNKLLRLELMKPESDRHKRIKSHISRLKVQLKDRIKGKNYGSV